MEVEIGRGKKARRAYGFDDVAIVPSRRTRDPDDVDISWTLGPYRFELPLLASAMDGVVSPETAGIIGQLGGLAVLNLEGIWTRYEDADAHARAHRGARPRGGHAGDAGDLPGAGQGELIAQRIQEIKAHGVVAAASLTPQKVERCHEIALDAGLDILVIQGTVISAEHVSSQGHVLNLKEFVREIPVPVVLGGCASYSTGPAPHAHGLRRRARGVGPGAACTTRGVLGVGVPQATAIADVAGARSQHMLETGEYVPRDRRRRHAHRRRRREGDRLRRRRGDDRLAARPRLRGARPRLPLGHGDLPPDAPARRPRGDHAERHAEEIIPAPRARTTARST